MPLYRITAPNGLTYEIEGPPGASDAQVAAAVLAQNPEAGRKRPETTFGGQVREFIKGQIPGMVNLAESTAIGASALLPEDTEKAFAAKTRELAKAARAPFTAAPGYEDSVGRKFGESLSSVYPFLAMAALGPVGVAGAVATGVGAGAGEARTRAEQEGATAAQRAEATGYGALVGSTEALPVFRIIQRLGAPAAKGALSYVRRAAAAGGEEAAQEAATNVAQNLIARGIYKPEQELIEGVGEAAGYGGATGALVQGVLDLALGRRAKAATTKPGEPTEEEKRLQAKKEQEAAARADALAKEQAAQNLRDTTARRFQGEQATLFKASEVPKPLLPEKTLEVMTPEGAKSSVLQRAEQAVEEPGAPLTRQEKTEAGQAELPLETVRAEKDVITERTELSFELESLKGDRSPEARGRRADINARIAELDVDLARREEDRGPTLEGKGQGELFGAPPKAEKGAAPAPAPAVEPKPATPRELEDEAGQKDLGIDALKEYGDLVKERESIRAIPKEERSPELNAYLRKLDQDISDRAAYYLDLEYQKRAREIEADKNKLREEELAAQSAFTQPVPTPAKDISATELSPEALGMTKAEFDTATSIAEDTIARAGGDKRTLTTEVEQTRQAQNFRRDLLANPAKLAAYAKQRGISPAEMKTLIEANFRNGRLYLAMFEAAAASAKKADTSGIKWGSEPSDKPAPAKNVQLFRGVPKGQEQRPTVGGALFMSPDRKVAETYAGAEGAVSEETRTFNSLLEAPTWADAKQMLGLPKSASMADLVEAARAKGYDGVTFVTTNGREYIAIDKPAPTPAPAPQVEEQPVPEPTVRQAPTLQTVAPQLDLSLRSLLGIGPSAKLFRPDGGIVGKDISDPAQAAEVKTTLEAYLERPTLSPNIVERINTFLQRPEFQGVESGRGEPKAPAPAPSAPSVSEQRPKPRRGKPSVAVSGEPAGAKPAEPGAGTAPTTGEPAKPVGRGLVSTEQPAGEGTVSGESKPASLTGRKISGVAGATEASKPINKAIDKLDDIELDADTTKGRVVQFARKLHREGLIDDASMRAVEDMSKDKDMGAQDVIDELKLALQDTKEKLGKPETKPEERRSVQPTIGKVQRDLGSLQDEIASGTGVLAGLLRRLLKSGKVRLEAISPTGDATIGGLYDGDSVVLYAAGIPKGQSVAVALHEVGAHLGLKNLLGEKQYKELSQRIIDMATSKTASPERALAQRALRRIPEADIARGEEVYRDEALAYFAEELVKAEMSGELAKTGPLRVMYNRIRAAVQATFNRLFGTNFGVNTFTPDQIGFLIKGAMGVEAFTNTKAGSLTPTEKNLSVAKGQEEPNPEVRFSRTMPQEDIDYINKLEAASPLPPEQEANVIKQGYEGVRKAQKVAGLVPWIRQHLVDRYASVLSKTSQYFSQGVRDSFGNLNNEVLLRQADDHAKLTQAFLHMGGIEIDKDGKVKIVKEKESVVSVFKKVIDFGKTNGMGPKQSMAFFSTLLEGNRLYGLEKQGFKVSMTREQLAEAKRILDSSPEAKAILDDLNIIRERAIKLMVATGRITQQQADAWNSAKDYVPFNRIFDEDEKTGTPYVIRGKGIAVLRNIPGLVGSYSRPVENVLDAFAERMGYMISESLRNQASVKTLEIMRLAGYADTVPSKEASKNPGLVVPRLYKDGQPVYYEVQNPYDLAAFQQAPEVTNWFINAMAAVSRVLRLSITAMPPFAAKQVLDDAQRAMFYSGVERPVVVAIKTLYNFPRIFFGELTGRKAPAVREMEAYGIVGDYDSNLVRPTQDLRYELGIDARSTGANVIHFLEKITKASDLAARTAVFEETIRETKSDKFPDGDVQLAQTRARELINFSRKGNAQWMRTLTKVVPFFNAYAQGMDVLYRAASGIDSSSAAERSAARKLFYSRMGIMMGMGFLYASMMSGDDDYESTTEEVRDNNWIFPGGYKLPVPKELGFIFKSIPERVMEYLNRYGTDEEQAAGEAFKSVLKGALGAYGGPTAVPSTVKPIFEHMTNYSFFLQRELVPSSMRERPAEFQYTSDTSELAKFVSKNSPVDIAPIVVDNYLRGFFGMAASTGLLMSDAVLNPTRPDRPLYQLPFASIVRYDTIGGREKAEFYDLREKVMKARNGYNDLLKKDPAEAEAFAEKNYALIDAAPEVNRLLTELSNLRKERVLYEQASAEVVGELSGEERRKLIDEIRKEEKSVLSDIRKLKKFIRDEQE